MSLKRPSYPKQSEVEVLYNYESQTARGHTVNVRPGERYSLLSNANDEWWYVAKEWDAEGEGFYLPRSYISLRGSNDDLASFKPTESGSGGSESSRLSHLFSSDGYKMLTAPSALPNNAASKRRSTGFKLADPQRISRSIPVDLNFVHNIPDLAAAQAVKDRMRDNNGEEVETEVVTAVRRDESPVLNASMDESLSLPQDPAPQHNRMSLRGPPELKPRREAHPYENMEAIRSRRRPPIPTPGRKPVRVVDEGWEEHNDSSSGHPFFFHRPSGTSAWKLPSSMIAPEDVESALRLNEAEPVQPQSTNHRSRQQSERLSETRIDDETSSPVLETSPQIPSGSGSPEPAPPSPLDEGYSSQMTGSAESGEGASGHGTPRNLNRSLTLMNRSYGLDPGAKTVTPSRPPLSLPDPPTSAPPELCQQPSSSADHRSTLSSINDDIQKWNKEGILIKCKYAEGGKRLKKQWSPCFVHLNNAHLIFYKDKSSAEKQGNHYSAPLGVCDLRGARFSWADSDKTRRKYVFQVELSDATMYLFHSEDQAESQDWFNAIKQVLINLTDVEQRPTGSRSASVRKRSSAAEGFNCGESFATPPPQLPSSPTHLSHKASHRDKKRVQESPSKMLGDSPIESRQTILERLRKFFRSRPSVESLKAQGIYKPEPVFGSSLQEICEREHSTVPRFVRTCTEVIEERGLEADGLYRISGNLSQIQKIRCQVDQDKYALLLGEEDIHVLSGSLKLFFRELQEPVFPVSMTKEFLNAIKIQNAKQRLKAFRDLMKKMPDPHRDTLFYLLHHLLKVADSSKKNRMQGHNLAIVFGPTLFSSGGVQSSQAKGSAAAKKSAGNKSKKVPSARPPPPADMVHSNSHLAFNMIMQGQIVEYLLRETERVFE